MNKLENVLRVGFLQTNIDCHFAWKNIDDGSDQPFINAASEEKVANEIRKGFRYFSELESQPQIICMPEYTIPHSLINLVELYAKSVNAVVFAGLDLVVEGKNCKNKGIVIVPPNWPNGTKGKQRGQNFTWGKSFFANEELKWFKQILLEPISEKANYVIDAGKFGKIGVAICSDFYDIERFLLYKGRIHHLIIISYNKDQSSFEMLTEAISRLLFCNVIICNSGHYGNSLAFSPYKKTYKRQIFKATGNNLFTVQCVDLPLKKLDDEQTLANEAINKYIENDDSNDFKWPPGYKKY